MSLPDVVEYCKCVWPKVRFDEISGLEFCQHCGGVIRIEE